ncbi:MAG: branched-chain amino acid ABC transporter permease [Pusillimonas sp.]|nr:MAG: branched-chain amino acid ABC transporter permease [Pusillimonas sp.]
MEQLTLFTNLLIDGVTTGCLYALAGIGFSLLWWLADVVHLAHGGVIIAAGYAGYMVITKLGAPLWVALVAATLTAVILGVLIERLAYHRLAKRGSGEMGMLTASLGLLICLEYAVTVFFGPEGVQVDAGSARVPFFPGSGVLLDPYTLAVAGCTAAVFAGLAFLMRYSQLGKSMRAVAENPSLAHSLGIKTLTVTTAASALAAAAGAPAALVYLYSRGVTPHDAIHIALMGAIVAIFGGRGSIAGALIAALVIGVAESVMVWFFDAGWREVMIFGLLYILLLVRPEGLLGTRSL